MQIYEAIAAGLILWGVSAGWLLKGKSTGGMIFLHFMAASALARLIFEGLRGSSPLGIFGMRVYQLAAWALLAASLVLIDRIKSNSTTAE